MGRNRYKRNVQLYDVVGRKPTTNGLYIKGKKKNV